MLKWKIALSFTMCLTWVLLIILVFVAPTSIVNENWFTANGKEYYAFVYVFNVLAWIVCPVLLIYEYRKRLPEAWYTHKFFWSVNLFINFIIILLLFSVYGWVNKIFNVLEFLINFVLVLQLFFTKARRPLNDPLLENGAEEMRLLNRQTMQNSPGSNLRFTRVLGKTRNSSRILPVGIIATMSHKIALKKMQNTEVPMY